jgi:hypothetical protein
MKRNTVRFGKDIRPFDTVCWIAVHYEDLQDIKKNSPLAVKVDLAADDHQSKFHDNYVAAAQECTEEGYIEVDDNAAVSTDEPEYGAYVQAWIWVDAETLKDVGKAKDLQRRRRFVTDILLPQKKKVTRGKKEKRQEGNCKGKAQSKSKSGKAKSKAKGKR